MRKAGVLAGDVRGGGKEEEEEENRIPKNKQKEVESATGSPDAPASTRSSTHCLSGEELVGCKDAPAHRAAGPPLPQLFLESVL